MNDFSSSSDVSPDAIRFNASIPLTEGQYEAVEKTLDEILAREDESVETCLVAGHVWLGMLSHLLAALPMSLIESAESKPDDAASKGSKNDSDSPDSTRKVSILDKTLTFYIESSRAEGFSRSFQIARRRAGNPAVKRMLLGAFISFRSSLRPQQWRLTTIARMTFQLFRHLIRFGSIRFDPLDVRRSVRGFRPSTSDLASSESQALLRRLFRESIARKDLIRHSDLFWGYCYLVLIYGLVQWYASALKKEGGKASESLALAIQTVEKHYLLDPDFNQTFLYHPALADVIKYLFRKANFAHTIIMG